MNDKFLRDYLEELRELRVLGDDFARKYPKASGNLKLNQGEAEDPSISRLLESFAFLTTRVKSEINASQHQITEDLFSSSGDIFKRPIPSFTIAKLDPASNLRSSYMLKKQTKLRSEASKVNGKFCQFRTCKELQILPIKISDCRLLEAPFEAVFPNANYSVEVTLETNGKCNFKELGVENFEFFVNLPGQDANSFLELISIDCLGFSLSAEKQEYFSSDKITAVGFHPDELVLPLIKTQPTSLQMLQEFYLFPEKHHFFKTNIGDFLSSQECSKLSISFYFRNTFPGLRQILSPDMLQLNCVPVVNLFSKEFESCKINPTKQIHQLFAELNQHQTQEIYDLDSVELVREDGFKERLVPLYKPDSIQFDHEQTNYYLKRRKNAELVPDGAKTGTEMFIELCDPTSKLFEMPFTITQDRILPIDKRTQNWYLTTKGLVTNRNLPSKISDEFGGKPKFFLEEESSFVQSIVSQIAWRPPFWTSDTQISHLMNLSQIHIGHFQSEEGLENLIHLLHLYNIKKLTQVKSLTEGLATLKVQPETRRLRNGNVSVHVLGSVIEISTNKARFSGLPFISFFKIIEAILADHCALNSFVRLSTKSIVDEDFIYNGNRFSSLATEVN